MKLSKVLLTVALSVLFIFPVIAKEPPEKILQSLPTIVESFIAENVHVYENPAAGASLGYNDLSNTTITFYLYDGGISNVEDGIASKEISEVKASVTNEIENGKNWANVSLAFDGKKEIKLDSGKQIPVLFTQFLLQDSRRTKKTDPFFRSDLYLVGAKGYICKMRITRKSDLPPAKEQEIEKFVAKSYSKILE